MLESGLFLSAAGAAGGVFFVVSSHGLKF